MKEIFVVTVPNTVYLRAYTNERRALVHVEALRRDGMVGHVHKLKLNPSEEE